MPLNLLSMCLSLIVWRSVEVVGAWREWTGLQVRHCFSLPASAPVQGDRLRCSPSRGSRRRAVASAAGVWAQQAAAGPCPPKYLCIATVLPLHMGAGHQPPETTGPGNKITDPH